MMTDCVIREEHLPNVHEVLGESRFEEKPEAMPVCSFRLETDLEETARAICEANGSSLSAFLRSCCRQLVSDYRT